jgi:putative flippase GtrA
LADDGTAITMEESEIKTPVTEAGIVAERHVLIEQAFTVWRYARAHSLRETFAYLKGKEAPFIVQFFKYGLCGFIAFITHNGVAFWLSRTVFPAMPSLPAAAGLTQDALGDNQAYANWAALAVSNIVAYVTNVLWVFTGGRHHRVIEFVIFTAINVVSGAAGIFAGPMLRGVLGTSWWIAQATLIVTSALVNFVCRKFLVFKH